MDGGTERGTFVHSFTVHAHDGRVGGRPSRVLGATCVRAVVRQVQVSDGQHRGEGVDLHRFYGRGQRGRRGGSGGSGGTGVGLERGPAPGYFDRLVAFENGAGEGEPVSALESFGNCEGVDLGGH